MKQPPSEHARLHALLLAAALTIEPQSEVALLRYLEEIIRENQAVNLTRIDSVESGIRLHLVDSLLALPEVLDAPKGILLDLGTGGGFPGVPLCLGSGRHGVLLDSVGKKAHAVNRALSAAAPNSGVVALAQRSEGHALITPSAYAVVTARAVAELPALVELASPLLAVGGRLVALKGAPDEAEIARGDEVAKVVGMRRVGCRRVGLPGGNERRAIVAYERVSGSAIKLPRRAGLAQRKPLA